MMTGGQFAKQSESCLGTLRVPYREGGKEKGCWIVIACRTTSGRVWHSGRETRERRVTALEAGVWVETVKEGVQVALKERKTDRRG